MSSSTTTTTIPSSPATATATALAALTTPFLQPPGCESHWTLSSVPIFDWTLLGEGISKSTAEKRVLVSQHVASCHPSGWDRIVLPRQDSLHFRPGVCPSAWTYYSMAAPSSQTISTTAFCCNRSILYPRSPPFSPQKMDINCGNTVASPFPPVNTITSRQLAHINALVQHTRLTKYLLMQRSRRLLRGQWIDRWS